MLTYLDGPILFSQRKAPYFSIQNIMELKSNCFPLIFLNYYGKKLGFTICPTQIPILAISGKRALSVPRILGGTFCTFFSYEYPLLNNSISQHITSDVPLKATENLHTRKYNPTLTSQQYFQLHFVRNALISEFFSLTKRIQNTKSCSFRGP